MKNGMLELPKETIERDWIEDFSHENGNYQNRCMECKQTFMGHKRRVICKKCATPNWEEISKRKPPEDTKDNKAWAGAWLEGEMVGYAKCMVNRVLPFESEALRSLSEIEKLKEELELERTTGRQEWERLQLSKLQELESQNKELMALNEELWGLWESMAECGQLSIGPKFSKSYDRLKLKMHEPK